MIRIENAEVFGLEAAVRGMRNPKNSWELSDSFLCGNGEGYEYCDIDKKGCQRVGHEEDFDKPVYCVGKNDLKLMQNLVAAGTDHSKFMRMINVTCDITAPQFWWFEFDTYKVGTVRNSCSKMHKIHVHPFEYDDFSHEGIDEVSNEYDALKPFFMEYIDMLEWLRNKFNETQEKRFWRALIEMLPEGYNMKATVQLNYQVFKHMHRVRKNHKLDEWVYFCKWISELPYAKELITGEELGEV